MAPEQVRGGVGRRTDVDALGCVLYEVLSLQPAYDGRGFDLLHRVLEAVPLPVETRNPRRAVPPALVEICRTAMAKDPAGRYATAHGMGTALRAWLDGSNDRERRHAEAEAGLRDFGPDWLSWLPVLAVSFDDAEAYCLWRTKTTGREWRLPTEEEREKAARGVDGRRFPWGETEDPTLCKCRDSREQPEYPETVGSFPTAESVYGMGDAAGGVGLDGLLV